MIGVLLSIQTVIDDMVFVFGVKFNIPFSVPKGYQGWNLTETVHRPPGFVTRKIYEPSIIFTSPTLCVKLAFSLEYKCTLFKCTIPFSL